MTILIRKMDEIRVIYSKELGCFWYRITYVMKLRVFPSAV